MKRLIITTLTVLLLMLALIAPTAHAVLERVGPLSNDPSVGGYPAWYQDTTGLALEFCNPLNQAEVDGGWCLLLPGDVVIPEVFPTNFFDEHFWYAADANVNPAGGGKAILVLALEAAFNAAVEPGGQITFSRIRVRLDPVPVTGTYRFIHPYGEELADGIAGDRIFFTDDVGIGASGDFTGALQSRLGPYLLPSDAPGGAELPAVAGPVPGKLYIADPARSGPVTGSPLPNFIDSTGASRNHNIFRIEGPAGSNLGGPGIDFIETTDFTLMGRIFQDTMAGRVNVKRASYARSATTQKVDVYATAFPTTQGRLPGTPAAVATIPVLQYFDAPCTPTLDANGNPVSFSAPVGFTAKLMTADGSNYFGQSQPALIPAEVCLEQTNAVNAAGQTVTAFFPAPVGDQVFITEAFYDSAARSLSVKATSSDLVAPPTLTVAGYGDIAAATGQLLFTPLPAPPSKVQVLSSARGSNKFRVSTTAGAAGPGTFPVATNDSFTVLEDSAATALNILTNDTNVAGGTVSLVGLPLLGTAAVNADGTVTYTPRLNASGTDGFTYRVTVGTQVTNLASATVNITSLNDPPVAVNDGFSAIFNIVTALDVLANDTDLDGAANIVAAANLTAPAPLGATAVLQANGRIINFTASLPGTYTFSYQARDAAGALSNTAIVTVNVTGVETITIVNSFFRTRQSRVRVDGIITPVAGQTLTIDLTNAAGTVLGRVGTAISGPTGVWALDILRVTLPAGTTSVRVTSSNGAVRTAPLVIR